MTSIYHDNTYEYLMHYTLWRRYSVLKHGINNILKDKRPAQSRNDRGMEIL